jgi:hypothetical protein
VSAYDEHTPSSVFQTSYILFRYLVHTSLTSTIEVSRGFHKNTSNCGLDFPLRHNNSHLFRIKVKLVSHKVEHSYKTKEQKVKKRKTYKLK